MCIRDRSQRQQRKTSQLASFVRKLASLINEKERRNQRDAFQKLQHKVIYINEQITSRTESITKLTSIIEKKTTKSIFKEWKSKSNELKVKKQTTMKFVSFLNGMYRLRKQLGFSRIKAYSQVDYMKTYLSALWRWKVSNVEARYFVRQKKEQKIFSGLTRLVEIWAKVQKGNLYKSFCSIDSVAKRRKAKYASLFGILEKFNQKTKEKAFWKWRVISEMENTEDWRQAYTYACLGARLTKILERKQKTLSILYFKRWKSKASTGTKVQRLVSGMKRILQRRKAMYLSEITHKLGTRTEMKHIIEKMVEIIQRSYLNQLKQAFISIKIEGKRAYKVKKSLNSLSKIITEYQSTYALSKWRKIHNGRNAAIERLFSTLERIYDGKTRNSKVGMMTKLRRRVLSVKKLRVLVTILQKNLNEQLRYCFEKWAKELQLYSRARKLLSAYKILNMGATIDHLTKFAFFTKWRDLLYQNPWFKRAAHIIAKNVKLNAQTAYWRLKDHDSGALKHLSAVKIVKCKKMFNNIRKLYELVLAKAFWMIESASKGEVTNQPSEYEEDYPSRGPSFVEDIFRRPFVESLAYALPRPINENAGRSLAFRIMKRIIYASLRQTFKKLESHRRFRRTAGPRLVNENSDLTPAQILRRGALFVITRKIHSAINVRITYAFWKLRSVMMIRSQLGRLRSENSVSRYHDASGRRDLLDLEDQNVEELVSVNERLKEDLNSANENLENLTQRINALITTQFIRSLHKCVKARLDFAFSSLQSP
eukprot:TRINITY_DN8784_c0_g7_i1.p1 TRINITY_DN8784_c0_g7~~TRINITY_DN8784_c0_g7_i1.p1  ORF type:complete len:781 (+),score=147.36 TRINITY_DN8784_c0_g7_i1:49-2343(+)